MSADKFYQGIAEATRIALDEAVTRIRLLEGENKRLREIVADFPSLVTDQQDRIVLLTALAPPAAGAEQQEKP